LRSAQPVSLPSNIGVALCAVLLGLVAVVGLGGASLADGPSIVRATLANGLRVVIVRNTLAPVVATSVNYLVGSEEAPDGYPGTAHAQEHMMFRGSPGLSADQLADIGSIMGGKFNANTRESLTQYLFTVPAADLDVALHIEAVRMADVTDDKTDWDQERGAIEQEVAQDISNPQYVMYDRLRSAMFTATPYEHDALGTRTSFDNTTSDMLKNFRNAWYAPNNAILVVVGDVDPQVTLAKVKNLFGSIKSKMLPTRPVMELKPVTLAPISVETDRPFATKAIAVRLPGFDSPDFPALELLADVLASHRFDLYGLVPQGKAISTNFSLDALPKASIGTATVSIAAEGDMKVAETEIRAILEKVAREGVPPELVKAAKTRERSEQEFQKNSIEGLASVWSDAVALYGLHSPDDDLARIERVTPAEVNRVARKYLDLDQSIAVSMIPRAGGRPVTSDASFTGTESITLGEAKPTPLPDWAQSALGQLAVPHSTLHPVVSTLPNGITLIVQPEDASDTVSVYGHIKNRPETETNSGKDGVAQVLSALFNYGSEHLDRVAFQQALDSIGASERAGPDFSVEILAQDFDRGVALLADNELRPALPADALRVVRNQIRQSVAGRMRTPAFLARKSLLESLFPKTDPSLREPIPENVSSLTMDDVLAYYHTVFRPDLSTIVVIGKIKPAKARAIIEKYFGDWHATGPKPVTDLPAVPINSFAALTVPDESRVQDSVTLAENFALTRNDPDYYALALGNAVLGGGFYSTRLSIELRKNTGLVYSVGANLQSGTTRSVYTVSYACDPGNVIKAANIVTRELTDMQSTTVSADELMRVKALLLRQIPLGEASEQGIARGFISRRDLELPLNEPTIAATRYAVLSADEVRAAFRKWLRPGDLVRVSQGPALQ
jgi:zinc protease